MIERVPYSALGRMRLDWLDSKFHFAFSGEEAPMGYGFGPLRVWNDDVIAPRSGFGMHGHQDMEIITYVRRGAISHTDSLGNRGRTEAGNVQVMHAGTGIRHAEQNEGDEPTELFQIWVHPDRAGHTPGWSEAKFPKADRAGRLVPLASGEAGVDGALPIHQDATLYGATIPAGATVQHRLREGRRAYLVQAGGHVRVNGVDLTMRDGLAIEGETLVEITAEEQSEILLFDLP